LMVLVYSAAAAAAAAAGFNCWMDAFARADVKKAMHTDVSPNPAWPGPGENWVYTSNWGACSSMPAGTPSMVDFYRYIAPKLKRTVVFNGDTDPCVSYEVRKRWYTTIHQPSEAFAHWCCCVLMSCRCGLCLVSSARAHAPRWSPLPRQRTAALEMLNLLSSLVAATARGSTTPPSQRTSSCTRSLCSLGLPCRSQTPECCLAAMSSTIRTICRSSLCTVR